MGHKYKIGDTFLCDVLRDGNVLEVEVIALLPLPEPKYRGPDYPMYPYLVTASDGEDYDVDEDQLVSMV